MTSQDYKEVVKVREALQSVEKALRIMVIQCRLPDKKYKMMLRALRSVVLDAIDMTNVIEFKYEEEEL